MDVTPEDVATAVGSFSSVRGQGTLPNLLAFGRALKQLGVKVSLSQVIDASRSLELVDIGERQDFRSLLRSNLSSHKDACSVLVMVFDCFWRQQSYERIKMETLQIQGTPTEMPAQE